MVHNALIVPALIAAVFAATAGSARAEYPERQIRYLLHVSPGGATDVMARKLANAMEKSLGKSVIVENRAGGRGAAQLVELTGAKPDGHTIGAVTASQIGAFNQTLKQFNVDSIDWITGLVQEPYLFVVHAGSPIKGMQDLEKAIKEKAGFVVSGFVRGSGSHFAWEMFAKAASLPRQNVNWVPYDSVGDAVTAVLGRHGQVTTAYLDLIKDHIAAGNLRVIGTMTDKRLEQLPDVPTLREQGFDVDTSWQQFRGIIGPKGMPDAIKARLAAAAAEAMNGEDMRKYVKEASLVVDLMKPAEFTAYAHKQDQITKEWIRVLGLTR
jgi:putative tricarboxylic transport membrane protein